MSDKVVNLSERMKRASTPKETETMSDWAAGGNSFRDGGTVNWSVSTGGYFENQPAVKFEAK